MGTLRVIPVAASGQPAPVTLVELATKGYLTSPGVALGLNPPPPLTPPFAPPAGQSIAWAYPTQAHDAPAAPPLSPPGIFGDGASSSLAFPASPGVSATGDIGFFYSRPLGGNIASVSWEGFVLAGLIPPGAVVQGIYPVMGPLTTGAGGTGALFLLYGTGIAMGAISGGSGFTSGSGMMYYGASIGTSIAALAGQNIVATIDSTLYIDPPTAMPSVHIAGIAFAIYYSFPSGGAGAGAPDTSANDALAGGIYFWSEHRAKWPSILLSGQTALFLEWLVGSQQFHLFGSTQTDGAVITIQNISGDTVTRDAMKIFIQDELIGALVAARVWRGDAESAPFLFLGNVKEVIVGETTLQLQVEGLANWSAVAAPAYNIDPACPLTFAGKACGSTSPTPCDQTYGTCSSINRFAGVLAAWISETPNEQLAQPAPNVAFNPQRPF